jgi:formate dehydrogenase iron-sulfur subunit
MRVAILTDLTRCIGCRACVYACKEINGLPKHSADRLNAQTWTIVERRAGLNVRRHCMHCLDPACASVCPVAALHKTPDGPVVYEEDRCIGCRYCMVACPFHVPKYEWEKALPRVQKCILCSEKRFRKGKQPACTEVCPAKATLFGDRDALIREAHGRIQTHPDRYVDHIYGLEEAGGTSVLYLSSVRFEDLGFPMGLDREPYPRLTWNILSKIPNVVGVGGILMFGIWWIVNRRMELQRKERDDETDLA